MVRASSTRIMSISSDICQKHAYRTPKYPKFYNKIHTKYHEFCNEIHPNIPNFETKFTPSIPNSVTKITPSIPYFETFFVYLQHEII